MTTGTIRVCADNMRQARNIALANSVAMGYSRIGRGKTFAKKGGKGIYDFEGLK